MKTIIRKHVLGKMQPSYLVTIDASLKWELKNILNIFSAKKEFSLYL